MQVGKYEATPLRVKTIILHYYQVIKIYKDDSNLIWQFFFMPNQYKAEHKQINMQIFMHFKF